MKRSIATNYEDISAFSGRPAECKHHLIFGFSLRKLAEQDGLYIPLTNDEHNLSSMGTVYQVHGNPVAERLSKMLGQAVWERHYIAEEGQTEAEARTQFIHRYGRSFL